MVIKEEKMEDSGMYSWNEKNDNNFKEGVNEYVRVKDKIDEIWKLIGICDEVFVMCEIILIYEKKRKKKEMEESEKDKSNEKKKKNEKGKDYVRKRKWIKCLW